jgi:hypothetical protein
MIGVGRRNADRPNWPTKDKLCQQVSKSPDGSPAREYAKMIAAWRAYVKCLLKRLALTPTIAAAASQVPRFSSSMLSILPGFTSRYSTSEHGYDWFSVDSFVPGKYAVLV